MFGPGSASLVWVSCTCSGLARSARPGRPAGALVSPGLDSLDLLGLIDLSRPGSNSMDLSSGQGQLTGMVSSIVS